MRITRRAVSLLLLCLAACAATRTSDRADKLVVNKSRRERLLYRSGKVIRSYRIALGRNPAGPKLRKGDGKTPEGAYIISGRNAASAYHRSLRISYPMLPTGTGPDGKAPIRAMTS